MDEITKNYCLKMIDQYCESMRRAIALGGDKRLIRSIQRQINDHCEYLHRHC